MLAGPLLSWGFSGVCVCGGGAAVRRNKDMGKHSKGKGRPEVEECRSESLFCSGIPMTFGWMTG